MISQAVFATLMKCQFRAHCESVRCATYTLAIKRSMAIKFQYLYK
jgi:hypothetical protein